MIQLGLFPFDSTPKTRALANPLMEILTWRLYTSLSLDPSFRVEQGPIIGPSHVTLLPCAISWWPRSSSMAT